MWAREGWAAWYREARAEMECRYGLRRIPKDDYKEQHSLGMSPEQAAKNIVKRMEAAGDKRLG